MLRRFHFSREKDVSGISGCGIVACGVMFDDGQIALRWAGDHPSLNIYKSIEDLEYIHGHSGSTKIIWDDPPSKKEV